LDFVNPREVPSILLFREIVILAQVLKVPVVVARWKRPVDALSVPKSGPAFDNFLYGK